MRERMASGMPGPVFDVDPYEAALACGGDPKAPDRVHRVARVHAEVHQDLLDSSAVGENQRQVRVERRLDRDSRSQRAGEHLERFRDDFVDLHPVALR